MTGRRSVKIPPAQDVERADVDAFMEAIGWDADAIKRVTSVRISRRRVEVDVAPRPDVKVTVRQPIVDPELGE